MERDIGHIHLLNKYKVQFCRKIKQAHLIIVSDYDVLLHAAQIAHAANVKQALFESNLDARALMIWVIFNK